MPLNNVKGRSEMPHKLSRRIVIDASVAQASGGENATYPLSRDCRDFLKAVLVVCHQAVMFHELTDEWKNHESRWARSWRVSMVARKKLLIINPPLDVTLRAKLDEIAASLAQAEAMQKDCHLVEGALATDRCIASLDEKARALFAEASRQIGYLGAITWVNPGNKSEDAIDWLQRGASLDKDRQLGRFSS
jgi:hypothetical protein